MSALLHLLLAGRNSSERKKKARVSLRDSTNSLSASDWLYFAGGYVLVLLVSSFAQHCLLLFFSLKVPPTPNLHDLSIIIVLLFPSQFAVFLVSVIKKIRMRSRPALSRSFSVSAFTIPSAILLLLRYPLPGERWCLLFSLPLFTSLSLSLSVCLCFSQSTPDFWTSQLAWLSLFLSLCFSTHLIKRQKIKRIYHALEMTN